MFIDTNFFTFPFDDKRWVEKFAIGAGLLLAATFPYLAVLTFWLALPVSGYMLRIMRRSAQGEPPSLPEWDDWSDLFMDGLRVFVVNLVYLLPVIALLICVYAMWFGVGFMPLMMDVRNPRSSAEFLPVMFTMYGVSFLVFGLMMLLFFPLALIAITATTRLAVTGSLGKAFEVREVLSLLRRGLKNYLLAGIIMYAVAFAASFVAQLTVYTVVLCCLYPFLLVLAQFYIQTQAGALFGMAYYHTEKDSPPPPADPPKQRDTKPLSKTDPILPKQEKAKPAEVTVAASATPAQAAEYDDGSTDQVPMVDPKDVKSSLAKKPRATKPRSTKPRKSKPADPGDKA